MINFTEQEFIDKMNLLNSELKQKVLLLKFDDSFLNIINYKSIKSPEIISSIDYATRITILGFASKQEMFEIIKDTIKDEDETRHIFGEIDRTILVPNNFQGLQENTLEKKEVVVEKVETAEDILREIENPTPVPSSLPAIRQTEVLTITNQPNTEPLVIPPAPVVQTPTPTQTSTPAPEAPTPTQEKIPATTKETQLDSKLTENVANPAKSTYYKVDPYREQF